ncbi:small ribosomal subunit protein mS27 [Bacillus rossius redtenbacheri]|uniref:small ribosomal subunit protein mS27 n=1 Tax=Bacillus rossius redtenbacheri TaxID=93214 RepID=UPI002FDE0CA2
MLKTVANICRRGNFSNALKSRVQGRRWFLSQAYRCEDAWDKRLESPLLQQVKLEEFHYEVEAKFQSQQKISAIDVDLFANAARGVDHLDEVEDLVHKLRLSPSTADTLPSTPHALIRLFLAAGRGDELLRILGDRLNYGVFPDCYSACLLMDSFLEQRNHTAAAQVAVLQMLQEDWEDELAARLGLYACHMHLRQPGRWLPEEVPEPPDDGEEVKVRVKYLRNPYFDDHFDLRDPDLLVGKTLAAAGERCGGATGRTYQLVGWALYGKWGRALAALEQLAASREEPLFYQEGVERLHALVERAAQQEGADGATLERLARQLRDVAGGGRVTRDDLTEALAGEVRRAAARDEPAKVEEQRRTYEAWERLRQERLRAELLETRKQQRRAEIAEARERLERRERTIFFFDHQERWELAAEQHERAAADVATGVGHTAKEDGEDYIPPEIRRPKT